MSDRHSCRCRTCDCSSTSRIAGEPCPSCSVGVHRPSREIQQHLAEGLREWARIVPSTLGSSGLSDAQLANTAEAWRHWHQRQPCPVEALQVAEALA